MENVTYSVRDINSWGVTFNKIVNGRIMDVLHAPYDHKEDKTTYVAKEKISPYIQYVEEEMWCY